MSVSEPFLELSNEVTECRVRIDSLQASLDDMKGEYRKYVETQQNRTFKYVIILVVGVVSFISALLGAIVTKFLPS